MKRYIDKPIMMKIQMSCAVLLLMAFPMTNCRSITKESTLQSTTSDDTITFLDSAIITTSIPPYDLSATIFFLNLENKTASERSKVQIKTIVVVIDDKFLMDIPDQDCPPEHLRDDEGICKETE